MQREEKSERSRKLVLDAALRLFSKQGFRATSVRDIADLAAVSTGNLYHHFPDKESIFRALLDDYKALASSDAFPLYRVMKTGTFPDNIEQLGFAARDSVRQFRQYMALVFVDVIEFDGEHIRGFYSDMASQFALFVKHEGAGIQSRLRPGVPATSALQMVTRLFIHYFQLEILFGVPEPFGKDSSEIVREMAEMMRKGIVS
jgi:AcrR family transcriptional regulator